MKYDSVIFDIDGTIADCSHRLHHVTVKPKNWKAFEAELPNDAPIHDVIQLVFTLAQEHHILLVTGRGEQSRDATERWLLLHGIHYDRLYMRPKGDYREDYVVKKELLDKIRSEGYDPFIAIEDRTRCVKMYRENGLICLQVADGDY